MNKADSNIHWFFIYTFFGGVKIFDIIYGLFDLRQTRNSTAKVHYQCRSKRAGLCEAWNSMSVPFAWGGAVVESVGRNRRCGARFEPTHLATVSFLQLLLGCTPCNVAASVWSLNALTTVGWCNHLYMQASYASFRYHFMRKETMRL